MAKMKNIRKVEKKFKKLPKDSRIEEIYKEEVSFMCPVRGLVKQKVKIKRFKPMAEQEQKHLMASVGELVDKLEEQDDGLSIYNDGEELGIAAAPTEEIE